MANKQLKKVGIYQSQHDYPSLHIMVTDNPKYLRERLVIEDIEEAMEKVRAWITKALQTEDSATKKQERLSKSESKVAEDVSASPAQSRKGSGCGTRSVKRK